MRLLHTSDWHLGQLLHGHDRHAEHAAFLDWLLAELQQRQIDALLIAGDIFDSANPSAEAQQLYYGFLARAGQRCPGLQIVVIAGNHDSPLRIDAPQAVLQALRVHVLGQYRTGATPNPRLRVELTRRDGSIGALLLAIPFLRPGDLPEGHRPAGRLPAQSGQQRTAGNVPGQQRLCRAKRLHRRPRPRRCGRFCHVYGAVQKRAGD